MVSKKIVALFAVAAKAQDDAAPTAADGGRIFSDNLNGVEITDFFNSDSFNFGSPSDEYIYEDVGASNYGNDFLSYDGTSADDAGRPAQNDEDVKSVNLDQVGANAQTNRNSGYVQCRTCAGLTASACAANNVFETCNDAQDACQVEIRGTMTAANTVAERIWSGCASRNSCQANADKNFMSTDGVHWRYNKCKSSALAPRWYATSTCTICTKPGKDSEARTVLFGNGATTIDTDTNTGTIPLATIISNPLSVINTDIWAVNNWYTA